MKMAMVALATTAWLALVPTNVAAEESSSSSERVASETIESTGVQFGLQLGTSLSEAQIQGKEAASRVGLSGGIVADVPLGSFLRIQTELTYVQRGAETTAFGNSTKARLHYVDLPVMLKLEPKANIPIRPFLMAGPRLSYLVSATSDGGGVTLDRERLRHWDVGMEVGGGLGFGWGEKEVFVMARYSAGLVDVDPSPAEWRSQSAQLMAGILF